MRTEVIIPKSRSELSYDQDTIMMGSCFSEHIGERLLQRKFRLDLNPFGVLYNPVSIASGIQRLIKQNPFEENDLFYHQGWWHSFDHHSCFSNSNKDACLTNINERLTLSGNLLRKARQVFVTFGTSWVFHKKDNGRVVSNCHQAPAALFESRLLRVGDIVRMYVLLIQEIAAFNPELQWIFTVSPVRHWKNGPQANQISKATLLLAISELKEKFENVDYFPAYEIFMDDLRDYRYYADDMLHPGTQGIEYTWKKFTETYLGVQTMTIMREVEELARAKNHRPRNPGSADYLDFKRNMYLKTISLSDKHPYIDLSDFLSFFSDKQV